MGIIGGEIVENLAIILSFSITWVLPFVVIAGAIYLGYRLKNPPLKLMENISNSQSRLNLEVRGRIGGNARILDTPEGDNPPWTLQGSLYAGGLLWGINLLFVNREQQPVNITATLAIPIEKENPSKRFRVTALNKPIYKHRDERILYSRPEHLAFPVYIDSCRAVNGHAEFAIEGFQYNALGDSFTQIVGGHNHILEVEDLLSGKKAEFNL